MVEFWYHSSCSQYYILLIILKLVCFPLLGLRQEENTQHHVFRTKKNKFSVRRTQANLRKWKTTVEIKKKDTVQKSGLFHVDNNDEIAQDELLVKELALSSDIGEVKKSTTWAKDKNHKITIISQDFSRITSNSVEFRLHRSSIFLHHL